MDLSYEQFLQDLLENKDTDLNPDLFLNYFDTETNFEKSYAYLMSHIYDESGKIRRITLPVATKRKPKLNENGIEARDHFFMIRDSWDKESMEKFLDRFERKDLIVLAKIVGKRILWSNKEKFIQELLQD